MKCLPQIMLVIFLILGCETEGIELIGTYKSYTPNVASRVWKFVTDDYNSFVSGTELQLKGDSSFYMKTCGNTLTGQWHTNEDTLYLIYETNRWRNDSLQQYGFEGKWPLVSDTPETILISGNSLFIDRIGSKEKTDNKVYNVLKKYNDVP